MYTMAQCGRPHLGGANAFPLIVDLCSGSVTYHKQGLHWSSEQGAHINLMM